ncbi:MAG: rod shape-determining protein MreC [Ornithinimicrobium sp.]|uniref:rod shape-determining protein MreC n=1 Tax=Ornithinimicrobium sp. TaxID=1977084 RepID=UPI0026DFF860|nr:rod shape-determining protein MreC [Ornithinimicrobium sp.]MDO5740705.1 rod shape-determining protein MreC [Ornithinimicrobium sp.]
MPNRRRLLPATAGVLTMLTAGVLVLDLARPGMADPVREGVATVAGPVQALLSSWDDSPLTELTQERNELAAEVTRLQEDVRRHEQLESLDRSSTWGDHTLLPARVVGFSPATSPVGGRTVTIDVGADAGVRVDQTVTDAHGLVGRVLRVAPTSADVLLVGDAGVVVGVRFGAQDALGSVEAIPAPGLPRRGHGELTLTALGDTPIHVGDEVTTLGSPDDRPYAARIPLGTVTALDPDRGQLAATAVVTAHVDTDLLDLVAVVFVDGAAP